ncbi:MAG: prolipoprotein diacylglyceryl transferase [Bernardetiaceae bacterium]|jgi:protein-S-isoprenylcysteine O-methyltransferase Ste14|nr:prolipoprotein diacylglyceryl transferase [Bernardetiaceae bacterium]
MSRPTWIGKIAYGAVFVVALPLLLFAWARSTEHLVALPVPQVPGLGWAALLAGGLLMAWAMADLWRHGRGLPMNAYPPALLVTQGAYRWFTHPIYVGASLAGGGASLLARSASGWWLATPLLTLGWLALVYGFENQDLRRRFPGWPGQRWLALPAAAPSPAPWPERLVAALLAFGPWLALYETLIWLGPPSRPIATYLPGEAYWPVWPWTTVFYTAGYFFVSATVLIAPTRQQLRQWVTSAWLLTGVGIFLQAVLPFTAPPKPFVDSSLWGTWLAWERAFDGPAAAFPSFHVAWAGLAGHFYHRWATTNGWRVVNWLLVVAISLSCLTMGAHSGLDVLAGLGLYGLVGYRHYWWERTRQGLEKLANSWAAWQLGPLRVINHSLYAGVSAWVGVALACGFLHDGVAVLVIGLAGLAGAAAWAQLVEGNSGLSRPFGYYGYLLGGLLACAVLPAWRGVSLGQLLAALALAAPWVQAIGRLRCVVQGCCHGKPAPAAVGIRVLHPKSRVCALSHLAGQPIHPTPLYSILANVLIGATLGRLWYGGAAPALLVGLYFMLSGLGRFVEEAYRGEVQTPSWHGLKIHQWLAVASLLAGLALSAAPLDHTPLRWHWQPGYALVGLGFGLVAAFAMGMDFPFSNRRFSRLAG